MMSELPRPLRWYLWTLYLVTLIYVLRATFVVVLQSGGWDALRHAVGISSLLYGLLFIVLAYIGERTTLHVTGGISQSLSTAIHIAAILLFPAPAPMIITLVAVLISQATQHDRELYKRFFNVCHPTLTVGISSGLCAMLTSPTALLRAGHFMTVLPYLGLLILAYYVLDVVLLLAVIAMLQHRAFWLVWWDTYRPTILPELSASTIGILTAVTWHYDPVALILVILPVVALRLAFRAISQAENQAAALRRRGEQLEAVLQAGQRLRLQHAQADLLHTMAEAARALAGATVVAGYLRDTEDPTRLERIVLVPSAGVDSGPTRIAISSVGSGIKEDLSTNQRSLLVPLELESEGVAGMLRLVGVPEEFSQNDQDALVILATQATIALQNALLHERALAQASADGLTGLLNHKSFQTRLEEEVARTARSSQQLTVIMVDLDDFKSVNNTYGHQTGDAMLMAVAGALRESVRLVDVPARYGGDEFAIILPETTTTEGLQIAERVRTAIGALRVIDSGVTIRINASIGVATLPLHAQARETLIRAADQAAYAAKHTGKGRVCRPEDAAVALDQDPAILAQRLEHANMATVEALAAAVDAKDPYTRGHSQRVSAYAAALAEAMRLSPAEIARARLAGLLHDVGKIGVPDAILTKPGKLSEAEFAIIQQHSVVGERMLSQVPFLYEILPAVRHHHERWDGGGYPDNLKGDAIPGDAAILMVADSFDAMTSSRTYRAALPLAEASRRMREGSGTQFDPRVVAAFEQSVSEGTLVVLGSDEGLVALPIPFPDPEARARQAQQKIAAWMR